MDADYFVSLIQGATVWIIPVILAITLHEAAHGWAASRLGDPTARLLGRVTLNPLAHIDLFGTLILPAMMAAGLKVRAVRREIRLPVTSAFQGLPSATSGTSARSIT